MFTRKFNAIMFILICLILAVIAFQFLKKDTTTHSPSSSAVAELPPPSLPGNAEPAGSGAATVQKKPQLATSSVSSTPHLKETSKPMQNVTLPEPWQIAGADVPYPAVPLSGKVSQFEIVKVSPDATIPAVGEKISLPILNGKTVVANVESNQSFPNGDNSWSGHLEGYGNDYPIVMTYGENAVFATITTPEGSYSMESIGGSGWLYKNPSEVELSKPGVDDQRFPDIPQQAHQHE